MALVELLSSGHIPVAMLIIILVMAFYIVRQNRTFDSRLTMILFIKQKEAERLKRLNSSSPKGYNTVKGYAKSIPEEVRESISMFNNRNDS